MAAHFLRMLAIAGVADAVWPPPRSISHAGDALAVDAQQFRFEATCEDDAGVLRRAMARYEAIVRAAATKATASSSTATKTTASSSTVAVVRVVVEDCAAALGADTSYDYAIANATISAASVFGAAHGLETLRSSSPRASSAAARSCATARLSPGAAPCWIRAAASRPWKSSRTSSTSWARRR